MDIHRMIKLILATFAALFSAALLFVKSVCAEDVCAGLKEIDGTWTFFQNGEPDYTRQGLVEYEGEWFYLKDGILDTTFKGFVTYDGGEFFIGAGRVISECSGLVQYEGKWYFLANGQWQKHYSNLALYDGHWFVLENGMLDENYNGIYWYDGGRFLVAAGQLKTDFAGLYQHDELWFYLSRGQVCDYTGQVRYDGKWFAVEQGFLTDSMVKTDCYMSNKVWLSEPTCTESGEYTRYCIICGKEEAHSEVEPLGHSYNCYEKEILMESTCCKQGSVRVRKVCNNCRDCVWVQEGLDINLDRHLDGDFDAFCDGCGAACKRAKGAEALFEVTLEDAPADTIADILDDLQVAGVIATREEYVTETPVLSGNAVAIESALTYGDKFLVVTFNGQFSVADTKDIIVKKYDGDWYSCAPTLSDMAWEEAYATLNERGQSVFIYRLSDSIDGIRAVEDNSSKKFDDLEAAKIKADCFISWQMDFGSWDKYGTEEQGSTMWNGTDAKNKFSGMSGVNGMTGTLNIGTQMRHIAAVYRETGEAKYRDSVVKGLQFILDSQYPSGAIPKVYPRCGFYSDAANFNDDVMINALILLEEMRDGDYPFDSDIIPEEYMPRIVSALERGLDFILKSQIEVDGQLTAWCAQHDPVTYAPVGARSFELPAINGYESVRIVAFLMGQEQTPEVKAAVKAAINWFRTVEAKDIKYVKDDPDGVYFVAATGSGLWYRFYEIETNIPIFGDRDGLVHYSIGEISEERRNGYSWSTTRPQKLLNVYEEYGEDYSGRIQINVIGTNSSTWDNRHLAMQEAKIVEQEIQIAQ